MNRQPNGRPSDKDAEAERVLTRLFAHAEPRPMPPPADTEEIKQALYAEWDALTGRRRWYRHAAFAAAASLALGVGFWALVGPNSGDLAPAVAHVERVQGTVSSDDTGVAVGDALGVGAVVTTATGQLALRLANGGSLRLGPESRVTLASADHAELGAGELYFDSEGQREAEFVITTPLGVVRDVGTQFIARVVDRRLEVGVREGRVVLARGDAEADASVGEKLVVADGAGGIRREAVATFGREWEWVERLAPPFDIDGRTLEEFLVWFGRQTGRTVTFADPNVERLAATTVLNGSIDLEPLPKLAAVMTLTDLSYSLDGERVVIAEK